MWKALSAAMGANLFSLFFEPLLEARVAEVLSAATSEVRVSECLDADHAAMLILYFFNKIIIISSCHFCVKT